MSNDKNIEIKETHNESHNHQEDNVEWKVCCSNSSKSFIKYIVMVVMSIIILLFSITMIIRNPEQDNSIYFSLISSILALYVPAPTLDNMNGHI
jgi:hypothetical protein